MINGVEGMIGEEAVVTVAIPGRIGTGSVRARGEEWPAVSATGEPIEEKEVVLILEVSGGHLVVALTGV